MNLTPTRTITFKEVKEHTHKLFCYGWFRSTQCFYIGRTTQGWHRFFPHHVIDRYVKVEDGDEFRFWDAKNAGELIEMEGNLMKVHRPLLNTSGTTMLDVQKSVCLTCGLPMIKTRDWQRFCSEECRKNSYKQHREQTNRLTKIICSACKADVISNTKERAMMTSFCPSCFYMTDAGIKYRQENPVAGSMEQCAGCLAPYFRLEGLAIKRANCCPACREKLDALNK